MKQNLFKNFKPIQMGDDLADAAIWSWGNVQLYFALRAQCPANFPKDVYDGLDGTPVSSIIADPCGVGDNFWYAVWIPDSYFPPIDIVLGGSVSDAIESWLDNHVERIRIDEVDLPDYKGEENYHNGVPYDDESLHIEQVQLDQAWFATRYNRRD